MGREDWYRKTTWTESDQTDFWARLKRSRTAYNKAQYLRIQANYLSDTHPLISLELLDKIFNEFPEPSQIASAELQRGQVFLKTNKLELAINALQRALAQEAVYPNVRTQAWAVYGVAIIQNHLTHLYDAAEKSVAGYARHATFPLDRFHSHAILAVVNQHRGNLKAAVENARAALAETDVKFSGFSRHPDVGLVENPDPKLVSELKDIALV